ncbi:unnamed protein product [Pleuronectes platessa]|uniref:Uncharacterized protein n=1 Tax=Pleuronectes platessa TaxID=8262 RepID=A0A9N7ZD40_PLEPL|nr:unnamed protein product [Pleuronectes platessa]
MPPGLNGNGRTPPGRRGVAANATWQSNVCSYALIKQRHTGTVGSDCGPDGEPRPRPDGAGAGLPGGVRLVRRLMDEGSGLRKRSVDRVFGRPAPEPAAAPQVVWTVVTGGGGGNQEEILNELCCDDQVEEF